jgi:2,4-dienoyl-CoA reductase-like NADH-dependent reductase (Old Yellow Enzyme family)/thioredoxin reductase
VAGPTRNAMSVRPDLLASPFVGQRLRTRNRIVMMATVTNLGTNEGITDAQIAYYRERARGGVGAIVTEGLSVHPTSIPNPRVPLLFNAGIRPGLGLLATAVHGEGAKLLGQLWHVGRNALWNATAVPWAPTADRDPYSGTTPHEMSTTEVEELVSAFVESAAVLEIAGFDGVELHGAHGYLLTQMLSPWSNHRSDRYGGSLRNRVRFVEDVILQIRARTRSDFVVGLKLSIDEFVAGGLDLAESQRIIAALEGDAVPDYIGVSQANFGMPSLERHVPDMRFAPAPFLSLARGIREVSGSTPILFMGRVTDAALAESILAEGAADLIGMARALIADAHLPRKAFAGELGTVRPCVYCNVCWQAIHTLRPISCVSAPEVGREAALGDGTLERAPTARVVRIVGAGPAGLEAARVSASRGHKVHLYDRAARPGGQLSDRDLIPSRAEFARFVDYLVAEVRRLGVVMHPDSDVSAAVASSWIDSGDTVLIATGSRPSPAPSIDGMRTVNLETALERDDWAGEHIVVVDEFDDEPVYAAAELLAARGARVTLMTRQPQIGRRTAYVSLIGVWRRLDAGGIRIRTLEAPVRGSNGSLVVRHLASGRERRIPRVDGLVFCGPYQSNDTLHLELRSLGKVPRVLGDAYAPRRVQVAILEGHMAGRQT